MKLLIGIIVSLLFSLNIFAQETIRITTGEWYPFISQKLKYDGVVMRIIKESFALEDIKVVYEFFPWGRAEIYVREGKWDGIAVQTEHPDFYNSDVVIKDELVFFYLKNKSFTWNSFKDLQGKKIGGVIANTYGSTITQMEKSNEINIERVSDELLNLRKVLYGRIEITPMGKEAGYTLINTNFDKSQAEQITHHSKPIRVSKYRLSLSKKNVDNKKILDKFNSGLKKLKQSGKYDQYLQEFAEGKYMK